ncbi:hypothetical protein EVAR_48614_1 [Eumeta japonica]|uniref:Uncharacterized protein n=1 Tax=Eumeta variegata TaxID=151549 RepID=A0A4C1XXD6_EUMVA|nr:hypothetical protein EVAR_48614_1 [Eumeta japonica]
MIISNSRLSMGRCKYKTTLANIRVDSSVGSSRLELSTPLCAGHESRGTGGGRLRRPYLRSFLQRTPDLINILNAASGSARDANAQTRRRGTRASLMALAVDELDAGKLFDRIE